MSFMYCYQWFLTTYASADEADRKENKATMNMEWHIDDDFPKLARTIDDAILYAQFANAPITDQDATDAGMRMIMSTGVFERQYEEWHARPDDQKDWAHFKAWWPEKVRLKQIHCARHANSVLA